MLRTALVLLTLLLAQAHAHAIEWNGLFIAGDDSIAAFDNSQQKLTELLTARGLASATRLTASRRVAKQRDDVALLTDAQLDALEGQELAGDGQGCIVHLTSHGAEGYGFYLAMDGGTYLDVDYLGQMLDRLCSDQRTVVLISACYSGQFITDAVTGPNRIVLTAARADRPSFGCSASDTYTYWDGCLIDELPRSKTWGRLYDNVRACIATREAAIGAEPSEPQAWFGAEAEGWRIMQ